LSKVLTMQGFGFFTFTIPQELREAFTEKKRLSELRTYIKRKLKRLYGDDLRAITRWHWFGEDLRKYNPHFNAMVDGLQYISGEDIEELKKDYKRALERITGIKVKKTVTNPKGRVDLHYYFFSPESIKFEFLKKRGKNYKILSKKKRKEMEAKLKAGYPLEEVVKELYLAIRYHRLRYLTRPTFLIYQKELAGKLKGYLNTLTWGKFLEMSYEDYEDRAKKRELFCGVSEKLILLESGNCPFCTGELKWVEELVSGGLSFYSEEDIGNGYFAFDSDFKIEKYQKIKLPSREELKNRTYYANFFNQAANELNSQKNRKDIYG